VFFLETVAEKIFTNKEYSDIVRNTIISSVSSICDADIDDCVMEVCLIAVKKQKELEKHPDVCGWLNLTTNNVVKRFLAQRFDYVSDTEFLESIEDPSRLEVSLEDRERIVELRAFIDKNLKSVERELFDLKFRRRLSNDKIAKTMNIKRKTADARVTRLREKVKKILKSFEKL
jgi:RNA polymerase sigma factor (sigma-70 family)